jgi:hypothetical protein
MSRKDCFKAEEEEEWRYGLVLALTRLWKEKQNSTGELFKRETEPSRLEGVNREKQEIDLQTKTPGLRLLSTFYVLTHRDFAHEASRQVGSCIAVSQGCSMFRDRKTAGRKV